MARVPSARATSTRPLTCLHAEVGEDDHREAKLHNDLPLRRSDAAAGHVHQAEHRVFEFDGVETLLPVAHRRVDVEPVGRTARRFFFQFSFLKTLRRGALLLWAWSVSCSPAVLGAQPHGRRGAGVVFGLFASFLGFWSARRLLFGLTGAPAQTQVKCFIYFNCAHLHRLVLYLILTCRTLGFYSEKYDANIYIPSFKMQHRYFQKFSTG